MVSKSQLRKTYKTGDMRRYGAELLEYYQQCAGSDPAGVFSEGFLKNHVVKNGGFSVKKALKIAKRRSKNYTKPFKSTIMSEKGIKKICQFMTQSGRLQGHVMKKSFKNYGVASVELITIDVDTDRGEVFYRRGKGKVRLGIDAEGFICHYHIGDI